MNVARGDRLYWVAEEDGTARVAGRPGLLEERAAPAGSEWPESFWNCIGAIADDPTFEAPEELPWELDAPLPSFDEE